MSKNAVNPRLRNRRRVVVENAKFAAFTRRILRAFARRVATGDIEALADMTQLATELDISIRTAVAGLRSSGYSWTEIADRLGVTRQAVHKRWGGDR